MRNKIDELIKLLEPETEVKTFPKPKGRPKTVIFHDWVDEELLAGCISGLHQRYFNPTCRMLDVAETLLLMDEYAFSLAKK